MKLKKLALRGLIALAVMVALCMFFARTVQTITTPKVQLVTASSGRFEEKMTFHAQVHFPKTEDVTVEKARELNVTVKSILVKPGHYVHAGDVIFTAEAPTYAESMEKLREEYAAKARELTDLDIQNRKLSKESRQNDLYAAMLEAQTALSDAVYEARLAAWQSGIALSGDASLWPQQLALAGEVPAEVQEAVARADAAQQASLAAHDAFYAVMENKQLRVKDEVFKYINDRNALLKAMDDLSGQMIELTAAMTALEKVTAPRDGYVVSIAVKEGESYDGAKPAYVLSAEDAAPVLKAPLAGVERSIADGSKAEISSDQYGETKTTVEKTSVEADGSRCLHILLPEEMLRSDSGTIRQFVADGGVQVSITYRAKKSTTLLPPSAVRGQEGDYYVYLIEHDWGGFMSSSRMKAVKFSVTVLERSGKAASIAEDLAYQQIADREDRALTDGQTVMEYIQ